MNTATTTTNHAANNRPPGVRLEGAALSIGAVRIFNGVACGLKQPSVQVSLAGAGRTRQITFVGIDDVVTVRLIIMNALERWIQDVRGRSGELCDEVLNDLLAEIGRA